MGTEVGRAMPSPSSTPVLSGVKARRRDQRASQPAELCGGLSLGKMVLASMINLLRLCGLEFFSCSSRWDLRPGPRCLFTRIPDERASALASGSSSFPARDLQCRRRRRVPPRSLTWFSMCTCTLKEICTRRCSCMRPAPMGGRTPSCPWRLHELHPDSSRPPR
jgi:hypothetical protein